MAQQSLDAYLELVNVKGESQDRAMTMNIQLRSFELGFESSSGEVGDLKKLQQSRKELSKRKPVDVARLMEIDEKIDSLIRELSERSESSNANSKLTDREVDLAERFQFKITKDTDRSTPALFKAYLSTSDPHKTLVYPTATIRVRRTGVTNRSPTPYLLLDFTQLMVINWTLQSESDSVPKETVSFSFKTYTMSYYPQNADGSAGSLSGPVGWDFDKNEAI